MESQQPPHPPVLGNVVGDWSGFTIVYPASRGQHFLLYLDQDHLAKEKVMTAQGNNVLDFAFNIHRAFADSGRGHHLGALGRQSRGLELVYVFTGVDPAIIQGFHLIGRRDVDHELPRSFDQAVGIAVRPDADPNDGRLGTERAHPSQGDDVRSTACSFTAADHHCGSRIQRSKWLFLYFGQLEPSSSKPPSLEFCSLKPIPFFLTKPKKILDLIGTMWYAEIARDVNVPTSLLYRLSPPLRRTNVCLFAFILASPSLSVYYFS
jgi:hypothetical protein